MLTKYIHQMMRDTEWTWEFSFKVCEIIESLRDFNDYEM